MNARMKLAVLAAEKGTCPRRKIGAVLYDKDGNILGEGWNGVNGECACPGRDVPAGAGAQTKCYGIHGEVRALMAAMRAGYKPEDVASCYSTKAPCASCASMLLATSCEKIVFQVESNETLNAELWLANGRQWIHQPNDDHNGTHR